MPRLDPPTDVVKAACSADPTPQQIELVKTWLAAATNVRHLSDVLGCLAQATSPTKVDLARLAIARGADPNVRGYNERTPLDIAVRCNTIATPTFVALLLGAGVDVNKGTPGGETPLGNAIMGFMCCVDEERRRPALQSVTMLLRAGAAIDRADFNKSAEEELAYWERYSPNHIARDEPCRVLKALLHGVRAAGSWRAYERRFHRGTLPRFRSLVVRGRATSSDALLDALAHLPHRPFRAVLAFGP